MKLNSSFVLLYLSYCFFLRSANARGGLHSSSYSGLVNNTYMGNSRRLFGESHQQIRINAEGYMTNVELEDAILAFGKRCSNISRIYSIGESVYGVPLWVIEISDMPGKQEAEPAFKYIGNVHGDEPVGRELLMLLVNWMCDNYLKDPLVTLIIKNVHLHILPSMNPDGFQLKQRGNANNIDLNRDFPDQFFPDNNDENARQPETRAIMKWLREMHFAASASLHGGEVVANYPWDGTPDKRKHYYACPDDETFRFLAHIYSRSHYNMSLNNEFPGGITNGASWYPIYGGMQDWNYIHGGCFELTLEISVDKWPPSKELSTIWEYNKKSMLNLVAGLAKTGVHGRIFSSHSGKPLHGFVSVEGINYTIETGRAFADFHRLLSPAEKYKVTATVPGYRSKSTPIWLEGEAATVDFVLDPENDLLVRSPCECDCGSFSNNYFVDYLQGAHFEVYLILIGIIGFLCFLFQRRFKYNLLKQRGSRRHVQLTL